MQQVVVLAGGEPQLVVKTMDWQPILHALLDIQMFFAVFVQLMVALVQWQVGVHVVSKSSQIYPLGPGYVHLDLNLEQIIYAILPALPASQGSMRYAGKIVLPPHLLSVQYRYAQI